MKEVTSFEIQAKLYNRILELLKDTDFICRGEIKYKNCRFDLAIFDKAENLLIIIEIKNYKRQNYINRKTRQYVKYSKLCENLVYCLNAGSLDYAISQVKRILEIGSSNKGGMGG